MSKRFRGSYSVYKETVANKDIVSTEMFIISAVIGYLASSWAVWLIVACRKVFYNNNILYL